MKPIWIIDDDKSIRWVFEKALARTDMEFKTFSSVPEAINALNREEPQVVVSDIRMPNGSGLDFLQEIRQRLPDVPVIIMTAYSDLESAVAAFQGGAFEYLAKPFDVDQAIEIIRRAVEESMRQATEVVTLEESPEIIGQAPAMQEVFRAIGRLSRSHATVLINGESGTGKELVAGALPSPKTCWNPNCSAMNVEHLPVPRPPGAVVSNRPMAVLCFLMKSATCPPTCRPDYYACYVTASSTVLVVTNRSKSMYASSPRPIRISKNG
jgi:two-component system nitrogen regulation response regulator GlnG